MSARAVDPSATGRSAARRSDPTPTIARRQGHARPGDQPTTDGASTIVAARRPAAERLGHSLAELVGDPDEYAAALVAGLTELGDDACLAGQRRIAPGIGPLLGVRWPLLAAVSRGFRSATRGERSGAALLFVADRLFREPTLEPRWFAFGLLDRLVLVDPERSWQLLRRAAREAGDWITVDSLAHPVGRGILGEPYRWAELEQLVYAPSRWERRLVGSTIATIPFIDRRAGRTAGVAEHGLALVGELIGDAEADVEKALAWALRSLALVDATDVERFLEGEAERAAEHADGHRAWVVREALVKLPAERAAALREGLAGIRRHGDARSTSRAAEIAGRFGALPHPQPEPARRPTP